MELTILPQGKKPGAHCMGGWVGPRADLECEKISRPCRESNLGSP
jgi:hypothetical protein